MVEIQEDVNNLKIIFTPEAGSEDQLSVSDEDIIKSYLEEQDYDTIEIILNAPINSLENTIINIHGVIKSCETEKESVIHYQYEGQGYYTTFFHKSISEAPLITTGDAETPSEIQASTDLLPLHPTSSSLVEDKSASSVSDPIYWSDDSSIQPKPSDMPRVELVKEYKEDSYMFRYFASVNYPIIEDSAEHPNRFVIKIIGDKSSIQAMIKEINKTNPDNEIELMLFFPSRKSNNLTWIGMFCKKQQIKNKIILNIIFDTSPKHKKNFEDSRTNIEEMVKFLPDKAMVIIDSTMRDAYLAWFQRLSEIFCTRRSLQSTADSLALVDTYLDPANDRYYVRTSAAKSSSAFFKSRSELCETATAGDFSSYTKQETRNKARVSINTTTFAQATPSATSSVTPGSTSPNEAHAVLELQQLLALLEQPPIRTLIETSTSRLAVGTATTSTRLFDQPTLRATSSAHGLDERTEGSRRDKRMEPTLSASTGDGPDTQMTSTPSDTPDTSSRSAHLRARWS